MSRRKTIAEQMERYEPELNTGCWLWPGSVNGWGYGTFMCTAVSRSPIIASRASYEFHVGPIPPGLMVLHKCDTPPCINPAHLFLGDNLANMRDCARKGRIVTFRGEANANAILTEEAVRAIRADTRSLHTIARDYGVCHTTILRTKTGALWAHVT